MTFAYQSRQPSFRVPFLIATMIALLWLTPFASADEVAEASGESSSTSFVGRPKIALVLSGGGARGASHIGILQVMEELRIPIDFVTGNSMGAIVGGYYAAGYSPDELEVEITSINWVDIFRDLPKRIDRPFRRKQDDREFRVPARLGFKDMSFQFPKGLVQGQKLDLVLKRLALPVWDVDDFDDLNLPFRCAATNIETGDAVILGHGDLARAIRASMSVPGAFAPVVIDEKMLVDGMVSNNIPIDAAQAFGPDVVIAIDIGTPPLKLEQINSAFGISGQVLTLLMQEGTRKQLALLEPSDMLITPDLEGIATSDFPRVADAIARGRAAAEAAADELRRYSVSEAEWQRYLERQRLVARAPPVITDYQIQNDSGLSNLVIQSKLDVPIGEPLDIDTIHRDVMQIFAMDIFENVDWSLSATEGGANLEIHTKQKSWGTNTVRFKLDIDEDFSDVHHYDIGFRVTMMPVNRLNAEWRTDAQLGSTMRFSTEFYQPFTPSTQWFIAPRFTYEVPELSLFVDGTRVARYNIRNTSAQVDIGRQLGQWGELRFGIGYLDQRASPITGASDLPIVRLDGGAYFAQFSVDTVDNIDFPTRGIQGAIRFEGVDDALGAEESFQQFEVVGSASYTIRKTTFTLLTQTVGNLEGEIVSLSNQLGGFLRLSGLAEGEVAGPKTLFNALLVYQQLARPSLLGFEMPVFMGMSFESGGAWDEWRDVDYSSMVWAGSVWFGASTFLGPMYLGYGYAEGGNNAVYLSLGSSF